METRSSYSGRNAAMGGDMAQTHDHGGGVRSLRVPIPDDPLGDTLVHVVDTDRARC